MAKKANLEQQLASEIGGFSADPFGFVHYIYPWDEGDLKDEKGPYEWQARILAQIGHHLQGPKRFEPLQIAIASGHGIGKSALIAWIADWGISTCTDTRIIATANTGDQLSTKTIPEVKKWFTRSLNKHWWILAAESIKSSDKTHTDNWRIDFHTWSLEKTEAFAGLHNQGKRIILIFDEGSAIPDKIWEVAEGAMTDKDTEIIWLVFGNPTQNSGRFKRCFGDLKHRWIRRQIDSRTVPGTNKAQIQKWIEDYGDDSDWVRIRVKGEFPRAGSTQLISSELVEQARERHATGYEHYWKIISVDVARFGDDRSIIGLRQGPKLDILETHRGLDTIQLAQRVMNQMKIHIPRVTVVDGDGIGGGVCDYVTNYMPEWLEQNKPCFLQEFHGGIPASDTFMYFNRRAEMWGKMRTWLETADIPDMPELQNDLTGPQYSFSNKNQIQLERKEDMKKRGLSSPDYGDMLAMSFAAQPAGQTEEEALIERLARIEDPMWRQIQRVKATLDREKIQIEDNRPEWMREG